MKLKICEYQNYLSECPIVDTHDRFEEAHYFFHMMLQNYHNPFEFRYNLNAFIQSLRNVTFMLQKEKKKIINFDEWYSTKQLEMRKNEILKNFSETRTFIVHQGMLKTKSKASVGKFRGRKEKLCFNDLQINPFNESKTILNMAKQHLIGHLIDEEHSEIGVQFGIKREWVVEDIGGEEITRLCFDALTKMGFILEEAHLKLNTKFLTPKECHKGIQNAQILLETDLDPSLIKKWGWKLN